MPERPARVIFVYHTINSEKNELSGEKNNEEQTLFQKPAKEHLTGYQLFLIVTNRNYKEQ